MVLWSSRSARYPVTVEIVGSSPIRIAKTVGTKGFLTTKNRWY